MTKSNEHSYVTITSFTDECTNDSVPFGSILISMEEDYFNVETPIYIRTWKLPICITISGGEHLPGNSWLSKIGQLFSECALPILSINAIEIIDNFNIKIHFQNKPCARYIQQILQKHIIDNYSSNITITF